MFLDKKEIILKQPDSFWHKERPEPEQQFIVLVEENEEYIIDFETMTVVTNNYDEDIFRSDQFSLKQMPEVLTYIFERLFDNPNYMGMYPQIDYTNN